MNNVDNAETQKFAKMADTWWDPQGSCKPLHIINKPRLKFVLDHANIKNKFVLDIGCGAGILTESLFDNGGKVIGIDATKEVIEAAIAHANINNKDIEYKVVTAEVYAETNIEKFDVITCMELLEHVPNPVSLINSALKMLKPNGRLFISTINRNIKSYLLAIIGAEYVLNMLPKGTHEYSKFITPAELAEAIRNENANLEKVSGISYNPILSTANLTTNSSINYIAYVTKN